MGNFTREEWIAERAKGHVVVGGVEFYLYTEKVAAAAKGLEAEQGLPIPGTEYRLSPSVEWDSLLRALGYLSYDWSKPQSFFDEYLQTHGVAPRGVWYYPEKREEAGWLYGRFVSLYEVLERLGQVLTEQGKGV